MKALLLVNKVRDLCEENVSIQIQHLAEIVDATCIINQATLDSTNKKLDDFEDVYNKAACLITEYFSNSKMSSYYFKLGDLVATWNKLKKKFARRLEMG